MRYKPFSGEFSGIFVMEISSMLWDIKALTVE